MTLWVVCRVYRCMGNPKGVKQNSKALEKRCLRAMRLLDQGLNQFETARRLKVARQTVSAWRRQYRTVRPGCAAPGAPDASRC